MPSLLWVGKLDAEGRPKRPVVVSRDPKTVRRALEVLADECDRDERQASIADGADEAPIECRCCHE